MGSGDLRDAEALPGGGVALLLGLGDAYIVHVQRVDAAGNPGPPVRVYAEDDVMDSTGALSTDAQGNVDVAWQDFRNGSRIRYARVLPNDVVAPTDGVPISQGPWYDYARVAVRSGPDGEPRIAYVAPSASQGTQVRFAYRDPTPPTAVIDGPSQATVGVLVQFSGANSTDNDAITSYAWTFGDGDQALGAVVQHRFTSGGSRAVSLTVRDEAGNNDTATLEVQASDRPPTAVLRGPREVDEDVAVNFSAADSTDDGGIVSYDWTFAGPVTLTGNGSRVRIVFAEPGEYTVRLVVTDTGGQTDVAVSTILVHDILEPWILDAAVLAFLGATVALTVVLLYRHWRRRWRREPP